MKFDTGREAASYYAEMKDNFESVTNAMLLKIITDKGHGLQYQGGSGLKSHPAWANVIDTVTDLEAILSNRVEEHLRRIILQWAFQGGSSNPDLKEEIRIELRNRERVAFRQFETHLAKCGYLRIYSRGEEPKKKVKRLH